MINRLKAELLKLKDSKRAKLLQGYFKTGKGEYAEGDIFLGITVPNLREIAKKYKLSLKDIQILLNSKIHEHRLIAMFILTNKYKKSDDNEKKRIAEFYLKNTHNINNWDLIDLSAIYILGDYFSDKNRQILYKLTKGHLWEKRIAVLTTFAFIKNNDFKDSLRIAEILLKDKHDLIHKAVGWMLREIGKRNQTIEEQFLTRHCKAMPRTMLRYAIEKFPQKKRMFYLSKP